MFIKQCTAVWQSNKELLIKVGRSPDFKLGNVPKSLKYSCQDFVVASEYLVTACVVVPKLNVKEWEGSYWKLADFVVPGSSHCVYQDGEQFLYTVTMFKKTMDAFKNNAREKKFIVRCRENAVYSVTGFTCLFCWRSIWVLTNICFTNYLYVMSYPR